jgi:hypothetical protein
VVKEAQVTEILAQAMCQAHATQSYLYGRVYAVGRKCPNPWYTRNDNCRSICESPYLRVQDSHTAHDTWSCIAAYHIFVYRPATTTTGQRNTAKLGLKSSKANCTYRHCGPNYCCCYAAH